MLPSSAFRRVRASFLHSGAEHDRADDVGDEDKLQNHADDELRRRLDAFSVYLSEHVQYVVYPRQHHEHIRHENGDRDLDGYYYEKHRIQRSGDEIKAVKRVEKIPRYQRDLYDERRFCRQRDAFRQSRRRERKPDKADRDSKADDRRADAEQQKSDGIVLPFRDVDKEHREKEDVRGVHQRRLYYYHYSCVFHFFSL